VCVGNPDSSSVGFDEQASLRICCSVWVDGVSQKVLTSTLRGLERNGMVERTVATGGPVADTYRLSQLGATLYEPMLALYEWTTHRIDAVVDA
jgi:DNA-binding HxlR family transcriptional regulator